VFHHNLQLFVFREIKKFKVRTTTLGVEASFRCTPSITHIYSFADKDNAITYTINLFLTLYNSQGLHGIFRKQIIQPMHLKQTTTFIAVTSQ
jgi:hypothetical protein